MSPPQPASSWRRLAETTTEEVLRPELRQVFVRAPMYQHRPSRIHCGAWSTCKTCPSSWQTILNMTRSFGYCESCEHPEPLELRTPSGKYLASEEPGCRTPYCQECWYEWMLWDWPCDAPEPCLRPHCLTPGGCNSQPTAAGTNQPCSERGLRRMRERPLWKTRIHINNNTPNYRQEPPAPFRFKHEPPVLV